MLMLSLLKPLRGLFGNRAQPEAPPGGASQPVSPVGGAPQSEPLSIGHVWSDEPDALKLKVNRMLLPFGEERAYETAADADDSPLARLLLDMEGVRAVKLESTFVTAFLAEEADWESLMQQVPQAVGKFLKAGGEAVQGHTPDGNGSGSGTGSRKYNFGFRQIPERSREEQFEVVQQLLEREINPAVAQHGGHFTLLDVKDNRVYVQLGGGCQGCGMADVTLRQGVEQRLKEVLPEVVALIDATDHAAGTNPYYQPGK